MTAAEASALTSPTVFAAKPLYVVWELTLQCDLACKHCGSRAGRAREGELDTREALDVVRQLAAMGTTQITLIGGEAYLREDWDEVVRAIRDHGMSPTITTGGRGITAERARRAKAAGVDVVSVSIDGLREAHDVQRGKSGSFDSAAHAIALLRDAGVKVTINTQVNRLSFPDLDGVLDLAIHHALHAWQVQLTVPMGRAADRPEWLLQPYDLLEVMPKLAELAERGAASGVLIWPGNNVGYFGPHEETLRGRASVEGRYYSGCPAGSTTLGIESDGALKGCPSLPTSAYVGGNVRDAPITELWRGKSAIGKMRDRTVDDLWGYCRGCYYADVCLAGCTWTSHVTLGRPGNNPYCHHRALEHDRVGLRERLVRVEEAPGLPFDHGRFDVVVEPRSSEPRPSEPRTPEGATERRRLRVLA